MSGNTGSATLPRGFDFAAQKCFGHFLKKY
jgi:hypothetical protein